MPDALLVTTLSQLTQGRGHHQSILVIYLSGLVYRLFCSTSGLSLHKCTFAIFCSFRFSLLFLDTVFNNFSCEIITFFLFLVLGSRKKWAPEDLRFLMDHFRSFQRPPKFAELREAQQLCASLKTRSLAQIKTRTWALLCKSTK